MQPRHLSLPEEAIEDLIDGYLHVIVELDCGWQVGLISATRHLPEDRSLAVELTRSATPVIDLTDAQLLDLSHGRNVMVTDGAGQSYLIAPLAVEDFEHDDD